MKERTSLPLFTASMKEGRVGRWKAAWGYIPHFYVGGKEATSLSPPPSPPYTLSSHCRETLQGCCVDRAGAFPLLSIYSTQKCLSRHHILIKLFFCHPQNALGPQLKVRPNTYKACTRQPLCPSPHRCLQQCICPVLFIWQ